MRFMLPATLVAALGFTLLTACTGDPPPRAAAPTGRDVPAATWDDAELDIRRQERLLAVSVPAGVVILDLGGLNLDEHRQLLPAFVLAQQSLTVTS